MSCKLKDKLLWFFSAILVLSCSESTLDSDSIVLSSKMVVTDTILLDANDLKYIDRKGDSLFFSNSTNDYFYLYDVNKKLKVDEWSILRDTIGAIQSKGVGDGEVLLVGQHGIFSITKDKIEKRASIRGEAVIPFIDGLLSFGDEQMRSYIFSMRGSKMLNLMGIMDYANYDGVTVLNQMMDGDTMLSHVCEIPKQSIFYQLPIDQHFFPGFKPVFMKIGNKLVLIISPDNHIHLYDVHKNHVSYDTSFLLTLHNWNPTTFHELKKFPLMESLIFGPSINEMFIVDNTVFVNYNAPLKEQYIIDNSLANTPIYDRVPTEFYSHLNFRLFKFDLSTGVSEDISLPYGVSRVLTQLDINRFIAIPVNDLLESKEGTVLLIGQIEK